MAEGDRHPRLIRSTPRLTRDEIVNQSFPPAFRGLSEASVRAFLRRVADEYEAVRTRQDELFAEIEGLEARLAETPRVEEYDLLAAVGDETARVLRSAKESAEEIRRVAEEKAAELLREVHEEARLSREQVEQAAAERTREADEAAAEILREAERLTRELQEGAEARVTEFTAQSEAEVKAEMESARRRSAEMVAEAQATRDRMLTELTRRREALEAQLDMLRAGRDRLLEGYRVVKRTLDEATDALRAVDAGAGAEPHKRPRVTSPALPAQHSPEPEPEPEPGPEPEPTTVESVQPPAPPRVGSLTLGELDAPAAGPSPAPPLEREHVAIPSGVRVLGPEPTADGNRQPPEEPPAPHDEHPPRHEEVEEIFARLRARRQASEPEPVADDDVDARARAEAQSDVVEAQAVLDAVAPGRDPALRQRRRDVLEPLVEELARTVKRVVRDEQNVVLEAVREHRGPPSGDDVLPSVEQQDDAFADATVEILNEACAAGEAVARDLGVAGGANGDVGRRRARARELAATLARELMDPLRGKLGDALREAAASGDQAQVGERVRARYREWKGQRVDAACRSALSSAFARGLYDAVPEGVPLRWVTTDETPCPDCADNALEHTPRGKKFPTGHLSPPAHAGCHCLVLPAEAPAEVEVG